MEVVDDMAHRKAKILRLIADRVGCADEVAGSDDIPSRLGPSARDALAEKIRAMRSRRNKGA
jgi:hypothetical protein